MALDLIDVVRCNELVMIAFTNTRGDYFQGEFMVRELLSSKACLGFNEIHTISIGTLGPLRDGWAEDSPTRPTRLKMRGMFRDPEKQAEYEQQISEWGREPKRKETNTFLDELKKL